MGHREWRLSLRGVLFCPRKWIPSLSPADLLPAVGEEKVVVPQSVVERYNNTGVHLGHLSTWRLPFRRSGLRPRASFKNQSPPPFYGVRLSEFFNLWSHAKVHSDISCWKHCSEAKSLVLLVLLNLASKCLWNTKRIVSKHFI